MQKVRNFANPKSAQARMARAVGVLVLLIIVLLTSVRIVGTGEVGVVTRFGEVTGRELDEGIHLVIPFGIEQVSIYDIKIQKQTEDAASASRDLQDVSDHAAHSCVERIARMRSVNHLFHSRSNAFHALFDFL